ncbi:hypothetical protein [Roseovarius aestuarii]|uniref:hypothetical protein n=1 Tax=Roseovarius aestuarii TaxID=475083 RepID=UPI000A26B728|nr:hypothetical protein [Roseovarius aestuarii]
MDQGRHIRASVIADFDFAAAYLNGCSSCRRTALKFMPLQRESLLRAHAARKANSQDGLKLGFQCVSCQSLLWLKSKLEGCEKIAHEWY